MPFAQELEAAYAAAMAAGLWADTYSATNASEYRADGALIYFANPGVKGWLDPPAPATTREELRAYDPALFELLHWLFGDDDWHPTCPERWLPAPGRPCTELPADVDLTASGAAKGSRVALAGEIILPSSLTREPFFSLSLNGHPTPFDGKSSGLLGGAFIPAGKSTIRFAYTDLIPGEYVLYAIADMNNDGMTNQDDGWYGAYGTEQRSSGAGSFRLEAKPRCGVDLRVREP